MQIVCVLWLESAIMFERVRMTIDRKTESKSWIISTDRYTYVYTLHTLNATNNGTVWSIARTHSIDIQLASILLSTNENSIPHEWRATNTLDAVWRHNSCILTTAQK